MVWKSTISTFPLNVYIRHERNCVMRSYCNMPMSNLRYLDFCKYSQSHLGPCCPVVMSGIFLGD